MKKESVISKISIDAVSSTTPVRDLKDRAQTALRAENESAAIKRVAEGDSHINSFLAITGNSRS